MHTLPLPSLPATTRGTLLRGRLCYSQFAQGYRTGLEPVLMAAAIPAKPGQNILEIGCGAGAGLLCLFQRVAGLSGTGVEQDSATAELARLNLHANGQHNTRILNASFPDGLDLPDSFDHCMANPPWHPGNSSASPTPRRDLARRRGPQPLDRWVRGSAAVLRHKGSLTLALPAALADQAMMAMLTAGFGGIMLYPFWPKAGREARIVLVQARLGVRSPSRVMPGLVLHEADGAFTATTRSVLEDAMPLPEL